MAAAAHLTLVAPDNEKCTVQSAPASARRKPNAEYRSREHLTEREVGRLIEAVKGNRWGHRDADDGPDRLQALPNVHRNWSTFVGIRSTSNTRSCTSVDLRMAALPRTH